MIGHRGLVCLLLAALAWGQAPGSAPQTAPGQGNPPGSPAPTAPPQAPPPGQAPPAQEAASPEVPPEAPVITIQGLCENPPADKNVNPDCKTMVTRAEFEKVLGAVQPNMPPTQRRQFATNYAMLLIMANEAHKQGLDRGPEFEERLRLMRLQIAMQQLGEHTREKAAQVSDEEISDYYKSHTADFEEVSVQMLTVPRTKAKPAAVKTATPAAQKPAMTPEQEMKKQADSLRLRAAAGADIAKLQVEAYTFAGSKDKPPDTNRTFRRNNLPGTQASVMELKPGEVSPVFSEPTGHFIFKMEKKETAPLEKVRAEIQNVIRAQRMQEAVKTLRESALPKLDDKYFGAAAGPGPAGIPPPAVAKPPVPPPGPK